MVPAGGHHLHFAGRSELQFQDIRQVLDGHFGSEKPKKVVVNPAAGCQSFQHLRHSPDHCFVRLLIGRQSDGASYAVAAGLYS